MIIFANNIFMFLDQKEKLVMKYLFNSCNSCASKLISAENIIKFSLSKKHSLSLYELEDIMNNLQKENYIDFVLSDSKNGLTYCVSLKTKGKFFLKDLKKQKRQNSFLLIRTIALAILSFLIGVLLKAIFS